MTTPDDTLNTVDLTFWIIELQRGRPDAAEPQFKKILTRVEKLTRAMFTKFPRVGRFVELDDVIQNTLMRMLKTFRELRPTSRQEFYRLVNTLIRRELLDLTKRYYGPLGAGNHEAGESTVEQGGFDPEDLDRMAQFHEALEQLPSEQREVMSLVYYHGWQQAEIAMLFQISVKSVQRWHQKAVANLREQLPDFEAD
jgi:RNA polymerase sigma factor (sigma-70 family)